MPETTKRYLPEINHYIVFNNKNQPISILNSNDETIRIKKTSKIDAPFVCWVESNTLYAYEYPTLLTITPAGVESRQTFHSLEDAKAFVKELGAKPYTIDSYTKMIQDWNGNIFKSKALDQSTMLICCGTQEIAVSSVHMEINSTYILDTHGQKLTYNKATNMFEPEALRYEAFYTKVPNTELVGKIGDTYVSLDPATYETLKIIPADFMTAMIKIGRAIEVQLT